jgi:long-chain acyl-CoA synthetase
MLCEEASMERSWLKFYEEHVPPNIDYPDKTLPEILEDTAATYSDHTAAIFYNNKMTYAEFAEAVDQFAAGLQKLGVKKGDRVALFMVNIPQFLISYYGTLKAGAVVVPCNPLYVARELKHQLNDSGAETIVVMSKFYPVVEQVRADTPLKTVIVANVKEYFPGMLKVLFTLLKEKKDGHYVNIDGIPNTYWFQDFLASAPTKPQPVESALEDTACLLYTGGTTGVPKGAELSHRNIMVNATQCKHWLNPDLGEEIVLTALPLSHSYAMTTCMNHAVVTGATMLLIPDPRNLEDVLKNINKHRPSLFPGVPTMYVAVNNHPDISKFDCSSIKACISGAAGLPVEVQTTFQELTGGRLVEGYGLSEATPVTHANPVFGRNRIGTIGLPWPDTYAKIVDVETGEKEMPVGDAGELIIQGPQVMKGYWNNPEETAQTLRNGWLYTGDIATVDEEGYFKIVDRKKDMIIAGGLNIYPREVEEVLYEHPKVKEAVCVGIPHSYRGETVKAYLVLKEGQTATADEIMDFCRERMAKYKAPRMVEFRSELPKTMVGKILRRALREEEIKKLELEQ